MIVRILERGARGGRRVPGVCGDSRGGSWAAAGTRHRREVRSREEMR